MLDMFKKKEPAKTIDVPTDNSGHVMDVNKEVYYKDPKTGEHVYQRALTPEERTQIMTAMQKNAGLANKFMDASRKMISFQELMLSTNKEILASEKEINDTVGKIRDEKKLDRRWGFNFALGVLELRTPPNG